MPGGGIHIKNSADTEFFQLGQNSLELGLELRHTDSVESSMIVELDAITGRLTNLTDLLNHQDEATKKYGMDNQKPLATIWNGRCGAINHGAYQ